MNELPHIRSHELARLMADEEGRRRMLARLAIVKGDAEESGELLHGINAAQVRIGRAFIDALEEDLSPYEHLAALEVADSERPRADFSDFQKFEKDHPGSYKPGTATRAWNSLANSHVRGTVRLRYETDHRTPVIDDSQRQWQAQLSGLDIQSLARALKEIDADAPEANRRRSIRHYLGHFSGPVVYEFLRAFTQDKLGPDES